MSILFKTFDTLDVDTRQGWILKDLGNVLELTFMSLYTSDTDTVTFFYPTDLFNADTQWDATEIKLLSQAINTGHVDILRKFEADDPNLPKYRYDIVKDKVAASFKVSREARDAFRIRCERDGVSQASVIEAFLIDYANR